MALDRPCLSNHALNKNDPKEEKRKACLFGLCVSFIVIEKFS